MLPVKTNCKLNSNKRSRCNLIWQKKFIMNYILIITVYKFLKFSHFFFNQHFKCEKNKNPYKFYLRNRQTKRQRSFLSNTMIQNMCACVCVCVCRKRYSISLQLLKKFSAPCNFTLHILFLLLFCFSIILFIYISFGTYKYTLHIQIS